MLGHSPARPPARGRQSASAAATTEQRQLNPPMLTIADADRLHWHHWHRAAADLGSRVEASWSRPNNAEVEWTLISPGRERTKRQRGAWRGGQEPRAPKPSESSHQGGRSLRGALGRSCLHDAAYEQSKHTPMCASTILPPDPPPGARAAYYNLTCAPYIAMELNQAHAAARNTRARNDAMRVRLHAMCSATP